MKSNTFFVKNLLNFIEGHWNFFFEGDLFQEENLVSNDSTVWNSDVREFLKNICLSNIIDVILGHLNINSIRKRFDLFSEQTKGLIDVLLVSETKLDDKFPEVQFLIEGFHSPFRIDSNKNVGGVMLYVQKDIPAKLLSHDFLFVESFF